MDTTTKAGAGERLSFLHLEPDRDQIEQFVHAIFKHASLKGFVALRGFTDEDGKSFRLNTTALSGGLGYLIDVAEDDARRAAQNPKSVTWCPPLAGFATKISAAEDNVLEGYVITVECDKTPQEARAILEAILGPATIVVKSGGIITNGSGETIYKLHLHWRLAVPARDDDRTKLKRVRTIACRLVGADPTSNSISHPIRWPGSWHRKAEPRLCVIDTHTDNEVDLDTALEALIAAAKAAGKDTEDVPHATGDEPQAPSSLVAAAVEKISNDDREWADWNNLLMAMWRATDGSEEGRKIGHVFSAKSKKAYTADHKYDPTATNERWDHFAKSPPTEIGFGTLSFLATEADPNWREAYERTVDEQLTDPDTLTFQFHGDKSSTPPRWMVRQRIPETGAGLLSGQWGTLKTFLLLNCSAAVIAGTTWLGEPVYRRGGVLYFAPEGSSSLELRVNALVEHTLGIKPDLLGKKQPFAWVAGCPTLLNAKTALPVMKALARKAQEHFRKQFGVDLVLIVIDTMSAAAGWKSEDDNAQAQIVMNTMHALSTATNTFVIAADHFGKNAEAGSRGASSKEASADAIFAAMGTRKLDGTVEDRHLVVRKVRDGPEGMIFPFAGKIVDMGRDDRGAPVTTLVIDWNVVRPQGAAPRRKRSEVVFEGVLVDTIRDHGVKITPANGHDEVDAAPQNRVRDAFKEAHLADKPNASIDTITRAFNRAIKKGVESGAIVADGLYIWFPKTPF